MNYIATFYSHFGAVRFKRDLDAIGICVTLKPVPRFLSSSCGTCAAFSVDALPPITHIDEIEQIVIMHTEDTYDVVFSDSCESEP